MAPVIHRPDARQQTKQQYKEFRPVLLLNDVSSVVFLLLSYLVPVSVYVIFILPHP